MRRRSSGGPVGPHCVFTHPRRRSGALAGGVAASGAILAATGAASAATYTPAQITTAYGVSQLSQTGAGTTIAIVDADNDTTALSDVNTFSSDFQLPSFNTGSGPTLTVVGQTGSTSSVPATAATGTQLDETSIDLQWAHAIAPQANILLVESNDPYSNNLNTAINTAKTYAGVSVVSMSFGRTEFTDPNAGSTGPDGEASLTPNSSTFNDATFQQTSGHQGVSFLAATGDAGTVLYPAASSYVVAVGGTTLTLDANNQRTSETVWNTSSGSRTGAGPTRYEPKPAYQAGLLPQYATRIAPDVSWDADPSTGYNYVEDGTLDPGNTEQGGTSIAAPQWAGLIALADQTRVANGLGTLTTIQTLDALYALVGTSAYNEAFYDVTSGSSNGYSAGTGYDAASGLGSPNADYLVPYLATVDAPEPTSILLVALGLAPFLGRHRRPRAAAP
jgi:subtilase family serine protease